jgi:hypothetical protein
MAEQNNIHWKVETTDVPSLQNCAPSRPSLRDSAVTAAKLFVVIGAVLGSLWMLDSFVK